MSLKVMKKVIEMSWNLVLKICVVTRLKEIENETLNSMLKTL